MDTTLTIRKKFSIMAAHLDERARKLWAATEAEALGYGGVSLVARVTGISRRAIHVARQEIEDGQPLSNERIRAAGG